jgi:hypothetical protein
MSSFMRAPALESVATALADHLATYSAHLRELSLAVTANEGSIQLVKQLRNLELRRKELQIEFEDALTIKS